MEEIINNIIKENYPKGLSSEYTKDEIVGYMMAITDIKERLRIGGVMLSVYVVTYNDDYGRPIFDNCFNKLDIAKEYINDHDYLRMDETTVIKEVVF